MKLLILYGVLILVFTTSAQIQTLIQQLCPSVGIQTGSTFDGTGIIITTFSRDAMWAYDLDRNRRFPLTNTAPCNTNCHLSPDFTWITFYDTFTRNESMMRLNGDERRAISPNVSEVTWWTDSLFLIWGTNGSVLMQDMNGDIIQIINIEYLVNIQPGGTLALSLIYDPTSDMFYRILQDIDQPQPNAITLGEDRPYFNATAWSPNGDWLAFVDIGDFDSDISTDGGEIYAFNPRTNEIMQWTDLNASYGAVRINGHNRGDLSWSPDGTKLAFWVIELSNPNETLTTEQAIIHIMDVDTGAITAYCGVTVDDFTPNPPHLVWSPDSNYLAFGADLPDNDEGQILLALDVATGIFTQLSTGLFPTQGSPSVIAWGILP